MAPSSSPKLIGVAVQ
ncbi:TPA: hypothetical protein ACF0X1_005120 [Escherichia coli]